jgi:hypothetical protein
MATTQLKWPHNAEWARAEAEELAREIERLGDEAIDAIRSNPLHCEIRILRLMRHAAHIRQLMREAKHGR